MFCVVFEKKGKHINNVYLIKLYTLLVVFQTDLRCIRDGAWEESDMAKLQAISTL